MKTKTLNYYFDFLSPYSYFSWFLLPRYLPPASELSLKINYLPITLGTVLDHWQIKGPALVPPKRNYLFRHCLRLSEKEKIPFQAPAQLPFNTLYSLRLSLSELHQENNNQEQQKKVIETLWKWGWANGKNLENPDELRAALQAENLPADELLEKISSKIARESLRRNTAQAISEGVFGVPSFVLDGEVFWGVESLPDLHLALTGKDPLPSARYDDFLQRYFLNNS